MVTVTVVPELALGVNVHPVAVPTFVKSPAAIPVTDSLSVRVYRIELLVFVGVAVEVLNDETVGPAEIL
jgi:hypothetical protein